MKTEHYITAALVGGLAFLWYRKAYGQEDNSLDNIDIQIDGVTVDGSPDTTGISDNDVEALARVLASEVSATDRKPYTDEERRAVAWIVRYRAYKRGVSVYDMEFPWRAQSGGNPPFSSRLSPSNLDRALARSILSQPIDQYPYGKALGWFEPILQDLFAAKGLPGYHRDAQGERDKLTEENGSYQATVGRLELWS